MTDYNELKKLNDQYKEWKVFARDDSFESFIEHMQIREIVAAYIEGKQWLEAHGDSNELVSLSYVAAMFSIPLDEDEDEDNPDE